MSWKSLAWSFIYDFSSVLFNDFAYMAQEKLYFLFSTAFELPSFQFFFLNSFFRNFFSFISARSSTQGLSKRNKRSGRWLCLLNMNNLGFLFLINNFFSTWKQQQKCLNQEKHFQLIFIKLFVHFARQHWKLW